MTAPSGNPGSTDPVRGTREQGLLVSPGATRCRPTGNDSLPERSPASGSPFERPVGCTPSKPTVYTSGLGVTPQVSRERSLLTTLGWGHWSQGLVYHDRIR